MTKLCARGKAAAKRKFKVYPSAYANAYASKICAGKIKDPSGVKRKDFKGPKPVSTGDEIKVNPKSRTSNREKEILREEKRKNDAGMTKKANTGAEIKIKKVAKGLHKASALHKKQAKSLDSITNAYQGKFIKHDSAGIKLSNQSLVNYYSDLLK